VDIGTSAPSAHESLSKAVSRPSQGGEAAGLESAGAINAIEERYTR
jgi:hypothetical protein